MVRFFFEELHHSYFFFVILQAGNNKYDTMMKKTILTVILTVIVLGSTAQTYEQVAGAKADSCQTDSIQFPEFLGGMEGLMKYLEKTLIYPELAEKYGVEGRVVMEIIVETDGSLSNISAKQCQVKAIHSQKFGSLTDTDKERLKEMFAKLFAKEGYRVCRKMPKWRPGIKNGETVRVRYSVPLTFRLR